MKKEKSIYDISVNRNQAFIIFYKWLKSNPKYYYRFLYNHAKRSRGLSTRLLTSRHIKNILNDCLDKFFIGSNKYKYVNLSYILINATSSFDWMETPEGYDYWEKAASKFRNDLRNKKLLKYIE